MTTRPRAPTVEQLRVIDDAFARNVPRPQIRHQLGVSDARFSAMLQYYRPHLRLRAVRARTRATIAAMVAADTPDALKTLRVTPNCEQAALDLAVQVLTLRRLGLGLHAMAHALRVSPATLRRRLTQHLPMWPQWGLVRHRRRARAEPTPPNMI